MPTPQQIAEALVARETLTQPGARSVASNRESLVDAVAAALEEQAANTLTSVLDHLIFVDGICPEDMDPQAFAAGLKAGMESARATVRAMGEE